MIITVFECSLRDSWDEHGVIMEILSQEELDALFSIVKEPDEDHAAAPPKKELQTKPAPADVIQPSTRTSTITTKLTSGSSNVISTEEFDAGKSDITSIITSTGALSPAQEIKKSLMQNVPFLELLADFGGGLLSEKKRIEVKTRDNKSVEGYFQKFFFDEKEFNGGITVKVAEEMISVDVSNIATDEQGVFLITYG